MKERVVKGSKICLVTPKHNTTSPGMISNMGGPDNGHAILVWPERAARNNASSNRTTKALSVLRIASMDWGSLERQLRDHERHQTVTLKVHVTICIRSKSTQDSWTASTRQNYPKMYECWCSSYHKKYTSPQYLCEWLGWVSQLLAGQPSLCLQNVVYTYQGNMWYNIDYRADDGLYYQTIT